MSAFAFQSCELQSSLVSHCVCPRTSRRDGSEVLERKRRYYTLRAGANGSSINAIRREITTRAARSSSMRRNAYISRGAFLKMQIYSPFRRASERARARVVSSAGNISKSIFFHGDAGKYLRRR